MSNESADNCQTRFRSERTRLGFTHEQAGVLCGVSRRTVIDWEASTSPTADKLRELARVGFDPQFIVAGVRSTNLLVNQAGADAVNPTLSQDEWKLIKRYRSLGEPQRQQALALVEVLSVGVPLGGTTVVASGSGRVAGRDFHERKPTGEKP